MLPTYRLDHPQTDDTCVLGGWSYFWGMLFGPLYVLAQRAYFSAIFMLVVTAGIAAGIVIGLTVTVHVFDASVIGLGLMLLIVLGAFVLHGVAAVEIVRYSYLRRGWRPGY